MTHKILRALSFIALVLGTSVAASELVVIYDSGQTKPLAPLLDVFKTNPIPPPATSNSPTLGAADLEALLPIRSPGLSPGKVVRRAIDIPFARPFFLVGTDPSSQRWLSIHRKRLLELGAIGMLVEAETVQSVRAIAEIAQGLSIMPASAVDIAEALGLRHYPVLISKAGIEQ